MAWPAMAVVACFMYKTTTVVWLNGYPGNVDLCLELIIVFLSFPFPWLFSDCYTLPCGFSRKVVRLIIHRNKDKQSAYLECFDSNSSVMCEPDTFIHVTILTTPCVYTMTMWLMITSLLPCNSSSGKRTSCIIIIITIFNTPGSIDPRG